MAHTDPVSHSDLRSSERIMTDTPKPHFEVSEDGTVESPFPLYLSPSQINGLLMCGEQFRLTRLLHVPERPMWAGIGGSAVHRMTEDIDRAAYEAGNA